MKAVKWIVIGLAVLVVAIGATFYAILQSLDTDELRGLIEAEAKKATGRSLRLEGPIDLSVSLTPAVVLEKVRFDNAGWGSRPQMLDVGRVEAQVELLPLLEGRYVIERVVVADADILVETNERGEGNWALPSGEALPAGEDGGTPQTASGEPVVPEIGSVVVRDSRLVYRDGATGESLLLGLDSLTLTPEGELLALDAEGNYQEVPFDLAGRIGGLAMLLSGGDVPVELAGTVAEADFSLQGEVRDLKGAATPDLRVELAAESLAQFDRLAGSSLPALGPLDLSGRLGLDAGVLTVDGMALSLGGSDLAGSLTASLAGERPALLAELTGARLDLADLQADGEGTESTATAGSEAGGAEAPEGQAGGADGRYVIPDTPLPLALLQAADAEVSLKLGALVLDPQTTLRELDLALTLENGRLEVSRLKARAFEGALDASLSLDAGQSPPPLATRLDLRGLALGRVLETYTGSAELQAPLDVALDLKGAGASPRAIAASLDGSSEIVAGEGVITNRILAILATGLDQILGPLFAGEDQTRLNCLVSRFRFEDGLAVSQAQLLDSSTFSLAGTGTVDLNDETLDLKFNTRTREAALVSLAVPFVVTGTLADPQPAPDALGTAMKAAEFVRGGSNPLAALGQIVGGEGQAPSAGDAANGCVAALEQTADVPASQSPIGQVKEQLEKALDGQDLRKTLEDAAGGALGGSSDGEGAGGDEVQKGLDEVKKGLDGLFNSN